MGLLSEYRSPYSVHVGLDKKRDAESSTRAAQMRLITVTWSISQLSSLASVSTVIVSVQSLSWRPSS